MNMTRSNGRLVRGILLALSLVLLAGCGDDPVVEEDPKLTGTWEGQVALPVPGNPVAMVTLTLTEDDEGKVTGTMNYSVAGQGGSGPVTGTHNYPDVSLNLSIQLFGQELTGKYVAKLVAEDRMNGTFSTDDDSIEGDLTMTRKSA